MAIPEEEVKEPDKSFCSMLDNPVSRRTELSVMSKMTICIGPALEKDPTVTASRVTPPASVMRICVNCAPDGKMAALEVEPKPFEKKAGPNEPPGWNVEMKAREPMEKISTDDEPKV
jgi:hypothetical protein